MLDKEEKKTLLMALEKSVNDSLSNADDKTRKEEADLARRGMLRPSSWIYGCRAKVTDCDCKKDGSLDVEIEIPWGGDTPVSSQDVNLMYNLLVRIFVRDFGRFMKGVLSYDAMDDKKTMICMRCGENSMECPEAKFINKEISAEELDAMTPGSGDSSDGSGS